MKKIILYFTGLFMAYGLAQCKSGYQFEENRAMEIGQVYYQPWVAGVQGGGSGINLYIPITDLRNHVNLDSVYYRGKKSKLELVNDNLAIGRFISDSDFKKDIVMSNEPNAEYGNSVPKLPKKSTFDLNNDECIISYVENKETKYFKVSNIMKKETEFFPSAPPKE